MKEPVKIRVTFESGLTVECLIKFDENPKTAEALVKSLPFESKVELWGDEIYFSVPFSVELENARDVVEMGDVAYWPEEPSLCLFFGPTLSSPSPDIIKPYSPVNVIGKIIGDPRVLKKVREGEKVRVELSQ